MNFGKILGDLDNSLMSSHWFGLTINVVFDQVVIYTNIYWRLSANPFNQSGQKGAHLARTDWLLQDKLFIFTYSIMQLIFLSGNRKC